MAKKRDMLGAFRSAGKLTPLPPGVPFEAGRSSTHAQEPAPVAPAHSIPESKEPAPTEPQAPVPQPEVEVPAPTDSEQASTAVEEESEEALDDFEFSSRSFPPISGPVVFLLVLILAAFGSGAWLAKQPVTAAESDPDAWTPEPVAGSALANAGGPTWLTTVPEEAAASVSALQDPRNKYTLVVITYGPGNEDLAWATHDHLLDEGVEVYPPHRVGDKIVVFAGAAPTYADLGRLEREVHGIGRDGVAGIYGDAYAIRIDDYIKR